MCRSPNKVPHVLMKSSTQQATNTITQPPPPPPPPPPSPHPPQPINNSNNRRININSSPLPFNIARIVTKASEEGNKSVRFANIDDQDEIRYFERISFLDAKNVWYSESELYSFVQEGKKLALAYRNNLTTTASTTTTSTTTNAHAHAHQDYCYRGFENYTIKRQKHRLLSNRFNVLIQHRNRKDNISIPIVNDDDIQQLDYISQQCSNWSTNVALLTAINDYFVSYGGDGDDGDDGDNYYCDETSSFFPSVTDMIPPEFPIGIQRIMLFSSSIATQSRKRTRTTQQAATADNVSISSNSDSNSDVIRRRVKQRVVY